ncbi:3-phosphoshikimate 1-carboxyvinyltransferase [Ravibacter arvi]|uniref:3-phosphoshikimate 1-carboxyvinyltransferase n=1 Tax=Ravibacter arvi TaxID=2051041 RepID=UPI0031EAAE89
MKSILVHPQSQPIRTAIQLASSKSESNRSLIISALTNFKSQLTNVSEARDTQTLEKLLHDNGEIADVIDAGAPMRFLTAYFAVTGQHKILTGTARMCERPIGILVDALRELGALIEYQGKKGYPPMKLSGFRYSGRRDITIKSNVSSQYISALLLIAPTLPDGLLLHLDGEIGSRPYIEMTLEQMAHFGITYTADWDGKTIHVPHQAYEPKAFAVESDWSGASYWYSLVALANDAEIELLGLKQQSLQGDSAIVDIMEHLGVRTLYTDRGVLLQKKEAVDNLFWDFSGCPDLVQTVAVCCAAKGIALSMTGIESLKIKETDRVAALQSELQKIGAALIETEANSRYSVVKTGPGDALPVIDTYDDHRMAMAFAPVGIKRAILIEEPGVVVKSYPGFWKDLETVTKLEEHAGLDS